LPEHAHLIFNNTRVIAARLKFKKSSGGGIEIFLLEPENGNYENLYHIGKTRWKCLVGGSKKWKNNEALLLEINGGELTTVVLARSIEKNDTYCLIEFEWNEEITFSDVLLKTGLIPLPPYIKRENTEADKARYQTVYAKQEGSVAAPTAGLHFTETIFSSLNKKGINHSFLTLHVGAGTFKPVTSSTIADHAMHEEYFEVKIETVATLADENKMIVAVGTTSLRTLESLYWIGLSLMRNVEKVNLNALHLNQWDHLEWSEIETPESILIFQFLLQQMKLQNVTTLNGHTGICITPGYSFKVVSALITNFHQPQSTLLLLIAAIVGNRWKDIYEHALLNKYRFLSYGDGSILFLEK
jgi:S-adenosylmethionine:tRNA ribosyltransferase-isomerase